MIRTVPALGLELAVPLFFPEMPLAHEWCRGEGLELGAAAHNPFGLPGALNVAPWDERPDHPDRTDFEFFAREQAKLCGEYAAVDLAGEADRLPVADGSQAYVISSHVAEHVPNLIAAFVEWNRVLAPGGVVFVIVPKRDALPEDRGREVTRLAHFVKDWEKRRSVHEHPTEGVPGGRRGHYHVFTLESLMELSEWCCARLGLLWRIVATEETDSKVSNGHTLVWVKA